MILLRFYQAACWAVLLLSGVIAVSGWAPGSSTREDVPLSVRDNPSSYRPVYVRAHGWRPPPVSSSGGYSSGK